MDVGVCMDAGVGGLGEWLCTQKCSDVLICNSVYTVSMSTPDDYIKGDPLGVFVSNKPNSPRAPHTAFSVRLRLSDFRAACRHAVFERFQANPTEYRCMPAYGTHQCVTYSSTRGR